jgi:hypothetical protein
VQFVFSPPKMMTTLAEKRLAKANAPANSEELPLAPFAIFHSF